MAAAATSSFGPAEMLPHFDIGPVETLRDFTAAGHVSALAASAAHRPGHFASHRSPTNVRASAVRSAGHTSPSSPSSGGSVSGCTLTIQIKPASYVPPAPTSAPQYWLAHWGFYDPNVQEPKI
jgi:hypothetical protein